MVLLVVGPGCVSYEYEEEVYLAIDGSGRIRVSGSTAILRALGELEGGGPEGLRAHFEGEGLDVVSVRETERDGRAFLHLRGRFEDWNELCRAKAFQDRGCDIAHENGEIALVTTLPAPEVDLPPGVEPDALVALRFHLPSPVHEHDATLPIGRGNILTWSRTAAELFRGEPLRAEARFDETSTLATTLGILLVAVGLVLASVALAVYLLVRKGRRQLRADVSAPSPIPPARP